MFGNYRHIIFLIFKKKSLLLGFLKVYLQIQSQVLEQLSFLSRATGAFRSVVISIF